MLSAENTQTYSSSVNFVKKNSKHQAQITLLVINDKWDFHYTSISNTLYTDVHSSIVHFLDHEHILNVFFINVTIQ
jgi:hypothetical protein